MYAEREEKIAFRMEAFGAKHRGAQRQSSVTPPSRSKMGFLLMIAGAAFVTSFTLILFNFLLGNKQLSEELEILQSSSKESLLSLRCESDFCSSKSCVTTASRLMDIAEPAVDPCRDFYQYACGGYKKTRAVRYNEDFYSPKKESVDNLLVNIKKLMEQPSPQGESEALKTAKAVYESCMNTSRRNEMQNESLTTWLSAIQLPLQRKPTEEDLQLGYYGSWRLLLSKLEEYQIHTVFTPRFKAAGNNPFAQIEVDCLAPMLPPDTYLYPTQVEHAYRLTLYKEVIGGTFQLLDVEDHNRKEEIVEGIIRLEMDISRAIKRSPTPDTPALSVEHKQQLKEIWRPLMGDDSSFEMEVKSTCDYNLENIMTVLNNAPPEESAVYVVWRMMTQVMQYMGRDFPDLHLHYLGRLPSSEYIFLSSWRQCSDVVRKELGTVVAKGLIDNRYFTEEQLSEVREMFWELKTDFAYVFRSIPWLDDVTRGMFLEKLKNVKFTAGFPDVMNSTGILDEVYQEFHLDDNDSYFLNIMNLRRFKTQYFFRRLQHGSDADEEREIYLQHSPLDTTSSYDYVMNTVNVDLGLFRSPLFHFADDFPKYLKYGQALFMAKELSHAFDAIGNFYDGYGNRMEATWWPEEIGQKFMEFTQCLMVQHLALTRGFSEPVANVSNLRTLNNVIADLGSFFITYAGLSRHLQLDGSEEKPIPGLSLNKKQAYFLQAAQTFCELREKVSSDPESKFLLPSKLRVNGAVMNTEDFGAVFDCPVGSPMNPSRKCNLLQ